MGLFNLQVLVGVGLCSAAPVPARPNSDLWYGPGPTPWLGGESQAPFSAARVTRARALAFGIGEENTENSATGIDWVARGAVTTPISQGRCATCAQFSATANIEAQWHLGGGHPLEALAVQEMIDCSKYQGPYGMGWIVAHGGLDKVADYPLANHSDPTLAGCRSPCDTPRSNKSFATVDGASCLPRGPDDGDVDEDQLLAWLEHGPLSISIDSGPLNGYHGGIINGSTCNATKVGHAVLVVGAGVDENNNRYWKLKNSWGPKFGEGGYFRVQHGVHCLSMRGACQSYIGSPPSGL